MRSYKLSIEEHIQLGDKLKKIREELVDIIGLVSKQYPKTSTARRKATKAFDSVDLLRSALDDIVCSEFPDYGERTSVYY